MDSLRVGVWTNPETILLNDATHEDGAAEFGCARLLAPGEWIQVESITISWTDERKAAEYILSAIAGDYPNMQVSLRIGGPE